MPDGVHYCSTTALYHVWLDGAVIARANDRSVADDIFIVRRRRRRLNDFPASAQWMVAAYGD